MILKGDGNKVMCERSETRPNTVGKTSEHPPPWEHPPSFPDRELVFF